VLVDLILAVEAFAPSRRPVLPAPFYVSTHWVLDNDARGHNDRMLAHRTSCRLCPCSCLVGFVPGDLLRFACLDFPDLRVSSTVFLTTWWIRQKIMNSKKKHQSMYFFLSIARHTVLDAAILCIFVPQSGNQ